MNWKDPPQKNEGFNTKLRLRRFGGFHKYGYPNSWMVHNGKSIYKWMINGGTPILGNHHMADRMSECISDIKSDKKSDGKSEYII
jgi:hypothetical protein